MRRLAVLIVVMMVICATVGGVSVLLLYRVAFDQQAQRLIETVESQAELMEAVALYVKLTSRDDEDWRRITLGLIKNAHAEFDYTGLGQTGEFVIAERSGEEIHYLLRTPEGIDPRPWTLPWASDPERPMHRALMGITGSFVGPDYAGVTVLAATHSVDVLDMGLVAKLDVAEVRAPFIHAGMVIAGIAVVLIAIGTVVFFLVGEPVVRRLEESEAHYRRLFDHSPTPILIVDPVTTLPVAFNNALLAVLGYTRDEFAALPLAVYEAKETEREIADHLDRLMIEGGEFETRWRTKAGAIRSILVHARVVEFNGRPVCHAVITDITRRQTAEARAREFYGHLLRMNRANELGQMLAGLIHEVRQPLTAAFNYTSACRRVLEQGRDPPERASELAAKASGQIERASEFIGSLKLFLQHEDMALEPGDINAIVKETMELAAIGSGAASLAVRLDLEEDLPDVPVAKVGLQQVLLNLVRNALEAMAGTPLPKLTVKTARREEGGVELSVIDTGTGISDEVALRLFQPFVTSKPGSMGIGLSLCRSIIEAHGGRLWWEPNSEGGAVFRFSLPSEGPHPIQGSGR
jgi:two-component system sensor kinase FixL